MRQLLWLMGAALIFTAGPAVRSDAASTLVFKAVAVDGEGDKGPLGRIYAGSQGVMTLGGYGWKSVTDAEEVARRLNALAEDGLLPQEISVHRNRRARVILARGQRIVQVDRVTAKVHGSDPARLARLWQENLRSQFGQPYLSVPPIVVPVGETRTAPLRGNIAGALEVRAETPVVSVQWNKAQRVLRVLGQDVGRTELLVADQRNLLRVPVRSAKYAARLTTSLAAGVTGNPAPADVMARAARAAVAAGLALEPGAWAQVTPWVGAAPPLAPGKSASVPVRVSAAGEDYLTYHARPVVAVRNEAISREPMDVLMVSNSPERLLSNGLWFEGRLDNFQSARFFYHHVNGTHETGELVIEVWNLGDRTTRLHVIAGRGGPSGDESWAGHRAATEFLGNRAANAGWIVPVPPRTAAPVLSHTMTPEATASGVLELRALEPGNLRVRLYLTPRHSERMPYPVRIYSESPFLGKWQYPQPQRQLSAQYTVGREWAFVTIGDQAIAGEVEGDRLAGNYGVIYEIALQLANPTAEPVPVVILLEPAGGPARGALLIDGRPAEAALLRRDSEAPVARYLLAPGEVRRVRIETMPQGGSNYPVRLVARPA